MGEKLKYKASELRINLEGCLSPLGIVSYLYPSCGLTPSVLQRARKIVGAYMDGNPFSVGLVAAVCSLSMSLVAPVAQFHKPRR